jgi:putative membrane protein
MARRHRTALAAGSLLSLAALLPPVTEFVGRRLSLHMLFEMLLLALAVPLLAYGTGPFVKRRLSIWVEAVLGVVALNLMLFVWQLPAVLDASAHNAWLRELAPAVFILGAFIFWRPIVRRDGLSAIAKIGYLMVAGVPPTIPGITLAFSHHVLYQAYRAIEDQQLAGLILFGTAKFALVGGTFVILWRMLAPDREPPDWEDREPGVDVTPPSAPAWLMRLDEELPAEIDRPRVPAGAR